MVEEQRIGLITALTEAYASMADKNSLSAYQESIEPLLEGISSGDRLALAGEFRRKTALDENILLYAGLVYYLDPPVGGS